MSHSPAAPPRMPRQWFAAVLGAAPILLSALTPPSATGAQGEPARTISRSTAIVSAARTTAPAARAPNLDQILAAIRHVESGGTPHGGTRAIGDGGRALGPFQIHRSYWLDARIPGRFEDCFDPAYARRVVLAYWRRHCPAALEALDAEVLARVHNGGPAGTRKSGTAVYWRRVERALARAKP